MGQGALAVECRADDDEAGRLLAAIDDPRAHRAVTAERSFLAELGGGCTLPVGALATPSGARPVGAGRVGAAPAGHPGTAPGELSLEGLLASRDGRILLRRQVRGTDPEELGRRLAADLLAHGGTALDDWSPFGDAGPAGPSGR